MLKKNVFSFYKKLISLDKFPIPLTVSVYEIRNDLILFVWVIELWYNTKQDESQHNFVSHVGKLIHNLNHFMVNILFACTIPLSSK